MYSVASIYFIIQNVPKFFPTWNINWSLFFKAMSILFYAYLKPVPVVIK